jgi:asparagine synthase (glutamine-hydrolysing)
VPAPAAIYKGQRRLLPGEFLHFQGGRLQKERYWKIEFHEAGVAGGLEPKRELLDTLRDASEAALVQ